MTSSADITNLFRKQNFLTWMGGQNKQWSGRTSLGRFSPQIGTSMTRFAGQSLETLDITEYRPGDNPQWLLPRLFARKRQWFVRRMHHRSSLRIRFHLDGSSSMFYPATHALEQKWVRQCYVAALFMRAFLRAGDLCEVVVHRDQQTQSFSLHRQKEWEYFLQWLESYPQGSFPERVVELPASLHLVMGDFLVPEDCDRFFHQVGSRWAKAIVVLFRHVSEETGELAFPRELRDPEQQTASRRVSLLDRTHFQVAHDLQDRRLQDSLEKNFVGAKLFRSVQPESLSSLMTQLFHAVAD